MVQLLCQHLTSQLQEWGFVLNPYHACVEHKAIDSHQCTIVWQVDNLKISHVDPDMVMNVIDMLQRESGKQAPLMIKWGKSMTTSG